MSMRNIQCILIEDELPARNILKGYVADIANWTLVGEFSNALDGADFLARNTVDVIFLDIQLPKLSGISFIRTLTNPPLIVITSAYSEHAVEAFELTVFDYLLKPYPFKRFMKTINRINGHFLDQVSDISPPKPEPAEIVVRENRENVRLSVEEIIYVESQKEYVRFVCDGREVRSRLSMQSVEDMLQGMDFLRVHRSFLVAVQRVSSFSGRQLKMGENRIPVGRYYQKEVKRRLG